MAGILQGEVDLAGALDRLLPTQQKFIDSTLPYSAYVGGWGSGKTVALCISAILRGQLEPGGYSLVGRLNLPALKITTRKTFLELFPPEWCQDWKETENRLIAKNGHEYLFSHLDMTDVAVKGHLRSLNLSAFYVDEGSEINVEIYRTLQSRLRRQNVKQRVGRLCSNPAGRDWMWSNFYDVLRSTKLKKITEGFIASTIENTNLPQDYVENLLASYPPDWAERFIYGSFADFTDKIYKDWNHKLHVYSPYEAHEVFKGNNMPPADWPVIVGMDIGGVDPWAFVFIAVEPETGFLYVYDEIYLSGILVRDLADEYFRTLGGYKLDGLAYDYENQQAFYEIAAEGVPGQPANKDVKAGIFKVGQYLHPVMQLKHPFLGTYNSPRLFISAKCENLIRELPSYSWAKDKSGNPTGKPHDGNDHTCDALRYAIHTFRPEPQKMKPKPKWQNPQLDELSRMFWRDVELHQSKLKKRRNKPTYSWNRMAV